MRNLTIVLQSTRKILCWKGLFFPGGIKKGRGRSSGSLLVHPLLTALSSLLCCLLPPPSCWPTSVLCSKDIIHMIAVLPASFELPFGLCSQMPHFSPSLPCSCPWPFAELRSLGIYLISQRQKNKKCKENKFCSETTKGIMAQEHRCRVRLTHVESRLCYYWPCYQTVIKL